MKTFPIKYKIFKRIVRYLKTTDSYHVQEIQKIEYFPKRIGKYFGFLHEVGHEVNYAEMLINYNAPTLEDVESYLRKYNDVYFHNKEYNIIYDKSIYDKNI